MFQMKLPHPSTMPASPPGRWEAEREELEAERAATSSAAAPPAKQQRGFAAAAAAPRLLPVLVFPDPKLRAANAEVKTNPVDKKAPPTPRYPAARALPSCRPRTVSSLSADCPRAAGSPPGEGHVLHDVLHRRHRPGRASGAAGTGPTSPR